MYSIKTVLLSGACALALTFAAGCASAPSASTEKIPMQVGEIQYKGRIIPVFDGLSVKCEKSTPPIYPMDLRRAGIEGVGTVMIIVDETGTAVEFGIVSSTPDRAFGIATLVAAKQWRYFAMKNEAGQPYLHALRMPITYSVN